MRIIKIINWLRSIELLAGNVYLEASKQFASDEKFSTFFSKLHKEEEWHALLLGKAIQAVQGEENLPKFGINIDSDTKEYIEAPFKDIYHFIKNNTLSKKEMVDNLIKAEFSEWNSFFVYAMKLVGGFNAEFQNAASVTEAHKERIQRFLEDLPEEIMPPEKLNDLTKIWDKKIFIVDEDPSFREFLSDILKSMGQVEGARDGQEGLEKIKGNFYDVIVSEINMEKKSGIDFYQESIELNPHISRNFLFCSYDISSESMEFFQDNNLPFLEKPISIRKLHQSVQNIIENTL